MKLAFPRSESNFLGTGEKELCGKKVKNRRNTPQGPYELRSSGLSYFKLLDKIDKKIYNVITFQKTVV